MDAVATAADLGQRIRLARLHWRLDQSTLAASAGLDRTALSKIETGTGA